MKDEDLLTLDNIKKLGFEYNSYDGYRYIHKEGFSINIMNINAIIYKGEMFKCNTVGDQLMMNMVILWFHHSQKRYKIH